VLDFEKSAVTIEEGEGSFELKVLRTNGSDGPVSVTVRATTGGSAAVDSDYVGGAEMLSFADGQTSATFRLQIIDDDLAQGDRELILVLLSPSGGASVGTRNMLSVTIVDNDQAAPDGDHSTSDGRSGALGTSFADIGLLLLCILASWRRFSRKLTSPTGS
jgi:hypothetical protein